MSQAEEPRRPTRSPSKRPLKRSRTALPVSDAGSASGKKLGPAHAPAVAQAMQVAGGPTEWSLRRFELWQAGKVCDIEILCQGNFLTRASKLELAVWSTHFDRLFSGPGGEAMKQTSVDDADAATLQALIRAIYERELTLTPVSARELLALSDRLGVACIRSAAERFMVAQLTGETAFEALALAEKHGCAALREAAIPLAAFKFAAAKEQQLAALPFADLHQLLGSDGLNVHKEASLFASIKEWARGPAASSNAGHREQQLLALVGQVRLGAIPPPQLHALIDDAWLQSHPKVLSAVAKGLVCREGPTARPRLGLEAAVQGWQQRAAEAAADPQREHFASEQLTLALGGGRSLACQLQVHPEVRGAKDAEPRLGLFLAVTAGEGLAGCGLTVVNPSRPARSHTQDFFRSWQSEDGRTQFWGSRRFMSLKALREGGFLAGDCLRVRVAPLAARALPYAALPTPGATPGP